MTANVFAFINQKGGVGKTTTMFHLARAAVLSGKSVLAVDMDPQGNTTLAACGSLPEDTPGLADVLVARDPMTIEDVMIPGCWDGLSVVPTVGESLGYVRDEMVISGVGRERRLLEALKPELDKFDTIFIDCAPTLDLLTINALTAATSAVIVTETKLFSASGLQKILKTVETIKTSYNASLNVAGLIINKHEEKTVSGKQWLEDIQQMHPVAFPVIPKSVAISDSQEAGRGLDQWPSDKSASLLDMYLDHFRALEGAH
jgi:chromosome partitioning protein